MSEQQEKERKMGIQEHYVFIKASPATANPCRTNGTHRCQRVVIIARDAWKCVDCAKVVFV
jgi:hypothetical protein